MSLFKCKMCGGDLEIIDGASVAKCIYCRTTQTVPKEVDDSLQNLFNRANALRIKGEFDKAEKLYERIIQQDTTQSEAYWGLILSKYGIEYVDDPATGKKVPTCHRASYDSIVADDDFKAALENCDASQRAIYEEQAKEIDRIQKEILALAQKEERYDVFICYKETDENGQRTRDSVIANDIYYQLTERGFKVFYAAITLEGKLGSAYEPIIFAALNSAKVMLTIGTKPEYFNAVWVKNEWSRYLKIIKRDRTKLLIPCYRDMDAYDLPEEFAHLQAQDMSKIGFINDIVRGIKKVLTSDSPKAKASETVIKETVVQAAAAPSIAPLLKRAFMFLEDGEFDRADDFCEQVLNQDPENAQAYLGKLMIELKAKQKSDLANCKSPFDNSKNYQKAIRFADAALADELNGYLEIIDNRIAREAEEARKEALYLEAMKDFSSNDISRIQSAVKVFASLGDYKDSAERSQMYEERNCQLKDSLYLKGIHLIGDYNPSTDKPEISSYATIDQLEKAIEIFTQAGNWKDAKELILQCRAEIDEKIRAKQEQDQIIQKRKELERMTAARKEKIKKIAMIATSLIVVLIIIIAIIVSIIEPDFEYSVNDDGETCTITGIDSSSVTNLVIPAEIDGYKVTSIGSSAFYGYTSLTSIAIPDSVTSIGSYAFWECTSLTSVYISNITRWCDISFGNSYANPLCYANNLYLNGELITELVIPNGVTMIPIYAFSCKNIESVTIPDSVTSIGGGTFCNCTSLISVTIGNGVTSIGGSAFYGCTSLKSITISDSVTSISDSAFSNCTSLTSVTIPDSVTSIGDFAFYNCTSLTSVTVPDSVTSIGIYAFNSCTSLTRINYRGSSAKWNAVSKGTNWDAYYDGSYYRKINYTMMYNYTGE